MVPCSVEGCDNPRKYKTTGWCQTHYHRYWRTGTLSILPKTLHTDVNYRGAHGRVRALFGAASKYECVACGNSADEWAYDGADPGEKTDFSEGVYLVRYSPWPEFYMPMCFPCHRAKDAGARAARRTECVHGHEMTPENTYERPSRPGTRECKTCKAELSAARYQARKLKKLMEAT